ncbi:MAG: asparagine synthase [Chloroflexi bacterium]|nr:MAG: asparagine synthase [Chloroflexota bacterium]
MSRHLKSPVHKVRLTSDPEELFRNVDRALYQNDEPLATLGSVAHYLLMEHARELGITVLLTGQGADELTCGYLKYLPFYEQDLLRQGRLFEAVRVGAGFVLNGTVWKQFTLAEARRYFPRMLLPRMVDIRGPRLRDCDSVLAIGLGSEGLVARQAADLAQFSVPALLHWEDRMSMAQSREMRVPFLDYRLVSTLLPMEPEWKLRDGWTKWVLQRAMEPFLPSQICWRKDKRGFTTPEAIWLASDLRPRVERLLAEPMLRRRYAQYRHQSLRWPSMRAQDVLCPLLLELWARLFSSSLSNSPV